MSKPRNLSVLMGQEEEEAEPEFELEVEDHDELVEILGRNLMIPFDIACSFSTDIIVFGKLGYGNKIGQTAKYIGDTLQDDEGNDISFSNEVGTIVGDLNGRVVLEVESGFLGWLDPNDVEILSVIDPGLGLVN
jgi:hypothetical protein